MNGDLKKDYETAKNFWNSAFSADDTAKRDAENAVVPNSDGRELAPSEKLYLAAASLGQCKKILDYGCGRGWASIIAAKSGCADVTAADVSENAAQWTAFCAKLYGAESHITAQHVSDKWISTLPSDSYDGIFCSNVLDVIPEAVADGILADFARITKANTPVIIGMNYYMEPKDNPEKKMTVKYGNHVYLNDVLRLVCRTDEEWSEIFSRRFLVEKLEHFAWPGEETERRRLFYLRKKITRIRPSDGAAS